MFGVCSGDPDPMWDGVDWSPCYRQDIISTAIPLIILIASFLLFALTAILRLSARRSQRRIELTDDDVGTSLSPPGILNHGTSSLLTESTRSDAPISLQAIENTILLNTVREGVEKSMAHTDGQLAIPKLFFERIGDWVGFFGALALVGTITAGLILSVWSHNGGWVRLAVYCWMLLLSFIPFSPTSPFLRLFPSYLLPSVMFLNFPSQFFLSRSALIHRTHDSVSKELFVIETVLFGIQITWLLVYGNISYRTALDGVLEGLKAGQGSCAGEVEGRGEGELGDGYVVPKNPAEPRSLISRAFFSHTIKLVLHHYKHPLTLKDVPALREDDIPAVSLANWRLAARESEEALKTSGKKAGKRTPLFLRLLWHYRREFTEQAFWTMCSVTMSFFPPLGLQLLLKFVADRKSDDPRTDGKTPVHVAVLYVLGMAFGQIFGGVFSSQVLNTGRRICIRMRAVMIAEVFTKALRRRDLSGKVGAAQRKESGDEEKGEKAAPAEEPKVEANITNLVGVDAYFIAEMSAYWFYFLSCPATIIVSICLLYRLLGVSCLAGVAMILALTPAQAMLGKYFARNQKKLLSATDARLEAATEVLNAIKTIKFAAWEDKFFERMQISREKELSILKGRFLMRVYGNILVNITPPLVTVVTFAVYTVGLGNTLDASIAFTSLALFSMLRSPLAALLEMTTAGANAYVSANRIQDFLDTPETLRYQQLSQSSKPEEPVIGFQDAEIAYIDREEAAVQDKVIANDIEVAPYFKLTGLNINFPVGKFSLITGAFGSGKTTLLTALLGENYLLSGKIFMPSDGGAKELCEREIGTGLDNTVAYCPQTPWLMGTTIRQNILFGSSWDPTRYRKVLYACALERDLDIFDLGDQTICGSKGAVMSGGQKARIALARALYSSSKLLLLDDVLSAVDTQTATHIFRHCLTGPLMTGRTSILVTHAVGLTLPGAAYAVVLDAGNVLAAGEPAILKKQGFFEEEELADEGIDVSTHLIQHNGEPTIPSPEDGTLTMEVAEGDEGEREEVKKQNAAKDPLLAPRVQDKFFKAEKQETGQVDFKVYKLYFKALGSPWYWMLIVTLFVGSQAAQIETNAWIRNWANASERMHTTVVSRSLSLFAVAPESSYGSAHADAVYYLSVYILLNVLFGALVALRTIWLFKGSLVASKTLYRRLLQRVLGAKMRFFDSTPAGQILNRLSNDIQTIDQSTAEVLMLFTQSTLASVAVLVVICFATPAFIFSAAFICAIFGVIGVLYVAISRELKRTDSTTKSPVLVSFGEALSGMISIRAYADGARFTKDVLKALEINIRAFHLLWQANRVLSIYCEIAGSLVTVFAALFVLINEDLDAGAAGLSLSYAMTFVDFVLWIVRLWAQNEQNMNSTERIKEYLKLEPEEDPNSGAIDPPAHWPSKKAKIEVQDLVCAYAPGLPAVLRGISFTVEAGDRVGIVGRTGSGKSSLMLALFRFIEISEGRILIDGIDTTKVKIAELRRRLTILPQEAQLFSGTIRENLDPFGDHEDVELWEVLRQVGLASRNTPAASRVASRAASRAVSRAGSIKSVDDSEGTETELLEKITIKSLDEMVAKGASNFSHGARQLFALARGMLKLSHSSILVMDESTANLDHATDEAIQKVIREELGDTTMLIVAHRLRSVVTCDKILTLDHGQVLEYASPWELLQKEGSSFRDLCEKSGEESVLRRMAEEAHNARQKK